MLVGNELGLMNYDHSAYQRRPKPDEFLYHFDKKFLQKGIEDVVPGDVLLFRDHQFTCHCGIASEKHGQPTVIHGFAGRKKVVEDPIHLDNWHRKLMRVYTFPQLKDAPWLS